MSYDKLCLTYCSFLHWYNQEALASSVKSAKNGCGSMKSAEFHVRFTHSYIPQPRTSSCTTDKYQYIYSGMSLLQTSLRRPKVSWLVKGIFIQNWDHITASWLKRCPYRGVKFLFSHSKATGIPCHLITLGHYPWNVAHKQNCGHIWMVWSVRGWCVCDTVFCDVSNFKLQLMIIESVQKGCGWGQCPWSTTMLGKMLEFELKFETSYFLEMSLSLWKTLGTTCSLAFWPTL